MIESNLLGAAFLRDEAARVVAETDPSVFYRPTNQHIAEAIRQLVNKSLPTDPATVASRLREQGLLDAVGGPSALVTMQSSCPNTSSAAQWATMLEGFARRRRLLALAAEVTDAAYSGLPSGGLVDRMHEAAVSLDPAGGFLARYSANDLVAMDRSFRWLVAGMLSRPTYGMTAGEMKSLKTYVSLFTAVGVAAGVDIFGEFSVPEPAPVMVYVGEGGRVPYTARLERVAASMGVNVSDLPLFVSFDTAPVDSDRFRRTLDRDLAELQPGLVGIDPLYAFHGTTSDSRILHDEGALLSRLSATCVEAGAVLDIVNHYNQTGGGNGLKRITMAGGGEWCDTWRLLSHRETPKADDVAAGRFRLLLQIGSRQWGGSTWDLDLDVGMFLPDEGRHEGDITWEVRRHLDVTGADDKLSSTRMAILQVVSDCAWDLTKTGVFEKVKGNREAFDAAWLQLDRDHLLQCAEVSRTEGEGAAKREVKRKRWAPWAEPLPDAAVRVGPGSS